KILYIITFSNTLGRDKELLRKILEECFKDFSPKEVPIPKKIKNVDTFLHRWELDIFYEEIIRFIIDEEITDDAPIYVGDIDTVIFWDGHFLFIEEKYSNEKLNENQLTCYITLAQKSNNKIWYLIGDTPDEENIDLTTNKYTLCVIEPSGLYRNYRGNLKDILEYYRQWLKECITIPNINVHNNKALARQIINDIEKGEHEDLSFEVAFKEYMNHLDEKKQG
ncbi:hypothetical protein, partial [Bacillus smithii]|uniref:hypothetical protein n=1 Tax=Bacillus smithii TaxID=1479 RepID=UPI003D1DEA01